MALRSKCLASGLLLGTAAKNALSNFELLIPFPLCMVTPGYVYLI